jgi:BirA family biotin operon repressor/biotin-[acetyl-CoA-carboxylase] ligase
VAATTLTPTAPPCRFDWQPHALQSALQALWPDLQVELVAQVDSTNTALLRRVREGDAWPRLLVAEAQSAGRGRLGRQWHATPGASLTFSLALPLGRADLSGLSLAVGVALADALDPPAGHSTALSGDPCAARPAPVRIGLKWPNDLWLLDAPGRGRKLGGVLIETVTGAVQRVVVIGIGLNLANPARLPDALAHAVASLDELGNDVEGPAVLSRIAAPLLLALRAFASDGFAPCVQAYARRDLLLGQVVRALPQGDASQAGEADVVGIAEGVDAQGALWLRGDRRQRVVSGEVSVRLVAQAGDSCSVAHRAVG